MQLLLTDAVLLTMAQKTALLPMALTKERLLMAPKKTALMMVANDLATGDCATNQARGKPSRSTTGEVATCCKTNNATRSPTHTGKGTWQ